MGPLKLVIICLPPPPKTKKITLFRLPEDRQLKISKNVNILALTGCRAGQFRCGNGACVDRDRICNGEYDCVDAADERDCSKLNIHINLQRGVQCVDSANERDCSHTYLIHTCNGEYNCIVTADEGDCSMLSIYLLFILATGSTTALIQPSS